MPLYKNHIIGYEKVQLTDGGNRKIGYKFNIINRTNHLRISGGLWTNKTEGLSESKKMINKFIKTGRY